MMNTWMFIIGFIIFAGYMVGLIKAILWGHNSQRDEMMQDPELKKYYNDILHNSNHIDFDGMGNQGRVPTTIRKKRKKTSKKLNKSYGKNRKIISNS